MKSAVVKRSMVVKRSIVVAGHKTSVSLEDAFWNGLKEIARAAHDLVGIGRRNRCSAATRQSLIGPSAFRARLLSHPTFPLKGRARGKSRDDRRHCACFSLSLYGQPCRPSVVHNAAPDLHPAQVKPSALASRRISDDDHSLTDGSGHDQPILGQ